MKRQYYVLMTTKIEGINANSGFYTIGFPAITSFAGYFHNIQRKIDELITKNGIEGSFFIKDFSIACKEVYLRSGHPRYVRSKKDDRPTKTISASSIDEKISDGYFAFILRVETSLNQEDYEQLSITRNEQESESELDILLKQVASPLKCSGGYTHNLKISTHKDFVKANHSIKHKNYFYLSDEREKIQNKSFSEFLEYVSRPVYNSDNYIYKERYVAIVPGFQLLEKPSIKSSKNHSLRNNQTEHAYAEPILSLGRFQSTYSVLFNSVISEDEEETTIVRNPPAIFWQYAPLQNDLCVIQASKL